MGKDPFKFDVLQFPQFAEKLRRICSGYPEPPHPGIDLYMDLRLPVKSARNMIQRFCLADVKNSCRKVEPDTLLLLPRIDSAQNQDGPVDAAFSELDPLGKKSHTKGCDTKRLKFLRDIHEPVPVCVRLDNCEHSAIPAYDLSYPGVIVVQRREIYLGKCRSAVGHKSPAKKSNRNYFLYHLSSLDVKAISCTPKLKHRMLAGSLNHAK